jgi:hypothetical protein
LTDVVATTTVTVTNNALDATFELEMDDNATTSFDSSNWDQNIKYGGKGTTIKPQASHAGSVVTSATLARAFFFAFGANSGDAPLAGVLLKPGSGGDWTTLSIKNWDLSNKSVYFFWFETGTSEVSIEEGQEYFLDNETFTNYTALIQGDLDDTGATVFTPDNWSQVSGPTGYSSNGQSNIDHEIQIYDATNYVRCLIWDTSGSTDPIAGILLNVGGTEPSQADIFGQKALNITFTNDSGSTISLGSPKPPKPPHRRDNRLKWLIVIAVILLVLLLLSSRR